MYNYVECIMIYVVFSWGKRSGAEYLYTQGPPLAGWLLDAGSFRLVRSLALTRTFQGLTEIKHSLFGDGEKTEIQFTSV